MADGPSHRRYARLVYDFEVELTDVMAARAHTMDRSKDESGEVRLGAQPSDEEQIIASLNQVITTTEAMNRDKGFRLISGSLLPRPVGEDWQLPIIRAARVARPPRRRDGRGPARGVVPSPTSSETTQLGGCDGSPEVPRALLGTYGEVTTNGWRVCGPPPWSSQSKGRTVGDTRLVAVISTRIGCGVSDAATRVGSRRSGGTAIVMCTATPIALDCR